MLSIYSAKAENNRQISRDIVTYNASGTPKIWLGRGGLRGGDMGGWAVGFKDALNLLSYLDTETMLDYQQQRLTKLYSNCA